MKPFSRFALQTLIPALFAAFAAAFVVFACLATVIPLEKEPTVNVYEDTVRLRVVAQSDRADDQALKLKVRDEIVRVVSPLTQSCRSASEALLTLRTHRFLLEKTAVGTLRENGSNDSVHVTLEREYAPIRRYGAFTFPAGEYATLRIDIGQARGKNWWCVLYPPLCTELCRADGMDLVTDREAFLACGFTDEQLDALTDGTYDRPTARFALVDAFKKLFG